MGVVDCLNIVRVNMATNKFTCEKCGYWVHVCDCRDRLIDLAMTQRSDLQDGVIRNPPSNGTDIPTSYFFLTNLPGYKEDWLYGNEG